VLEITCGALLIEDHCLNCNHIIEWRIQDYKGKDLMLIEFRGYFVYHFVSFYVLVKFNVKIMVVILQLSQILVMKNHKKNLSAF
jgi:hypothetical protein